MAQRKQRIVSGIQPTGKLHVGNYLGAIKNFVDLQNNGKYDCVFFIADLHSLTETYEPKEKPAQIYGLLAGLLALGLDPQKSTIFLQSQIVGHTELAWLFSCVTPIAELERMTQYKDKASRQKANINAGLLTYPILQAADILMYHGEAVPVGQDQDQHVELTRVIAKKMNSQFGTHFPEPKSLHTHVPKVMSLKDPTKKMSKSLGDAHVINIFDDAKINETKIRRALSGTEMKGPSFDNFALMLQELGYEHHPRFESFAEMKQVLWKHIESYFASARNKYSDMVKDTAVLDSALDMGRKKAQAIATKTLNETKRTMGIPI